MEKQNNLTENEQKQNQMKQINRALGLFICFFAVIVLVSIYYTETFIGKMTNLGAGSILMAIGILMVWRSKVDSDAS
jgi:ABC-type transport system involved in cytochrome bd biosynthesis fused ATPase/permease subunit